MSVMECVRCNGTGVIDTGRHTTDDNGLRTCAACNGDGKPRCISCGVRVGPNDPAWTTLGQRCRRCW